VLNPRQKLLNPALQRLYAVEEGVGLGGPRGVRCEAD
jgi:hypothetical protein